MDAGNNETSAAASACVSRMVARMFESVVVRSEEGGCVTKPVDLPSQQGLGTRLSAGAQHEGSSAAEWNAADDLTCAICLDQVELAEMATIRGCQHLYCVNCILQWAGRSCEGASGSRVIPKCPVCKAPFEFLQVHRQLDGSLSDFPCEESVTLLRRARWYRNHVESEEKELSGFNHFDHRLVEEDDWRDDHYGDHNSTAHDDDDQVESYYTSRAAGRSCLTLSNRRWGTNGYIASGRKIARPTASPSAAKKYGKGKNKPFKGACAGSPSGPLPVSPRAKGAASGSPRAETPSGSSPLAAGSSFVAGSSPLSGPKRMSRVGAFGSPSSASAAPLTVHAGTPKMVQHGFGVPGGTSSGGSTSRSSAESPSLYIPPEAPSAGGLSLADFAAPKTPKSEKGGRRARRKAKRAAADAGSLDF